MTTRVLGTGLRTRLGRGLPAHAAALRAADASRNALPARVHFDLDEGAVEVPYALAAPLDRSGDLKARFNDLLEGVIADALDEAGLSPAERARTAVYIGTSSADIGLMEDAYARDLVVNPDAQPPAWRCSMDNLTPGLRDSFGLGPHGAAVNTACTAGANALIYADAAIRLGQVEHALVIGAEVFNATTALGFHSLELLTTSAMRPFDKRRDGLILGEACAALVLGPAGDAAGMRFLGGATLSDTHSISAANPDGSTIADVVRLALARAGVAADDITAIKAHATASLLNDEGEAAGLRRVFDQTPPIAALKPYIGHTFGASGLAELLMLKACLDAGFWPANPGVAADASELGVALNQSPIEMHSATLLLNQFGFGGNNSCLVVKHDA